MPVETPSKMEIDIPAAPAARVLYAGAKPLIISLSSNLFSSNNFYLPLLLKHRYSKEFAIYRA